MVVEVSRDFDAGGDFAWLTLGQIDELMKRPNVVNMDLRSVLSCLPFPSAGLDVHGNRLRNAICAIGGHNQRGWEGHGRRRQSLAQRSIGRDAPTAPDETAMG